MPSMTPMMSEILPEDVWISCMVLTTWPMTSPPLTATALALADNCCAWRALSAFWCTVALSCSMAAAVCSRALACCSVRLARSWLPDDICSDALARLSPPSRMWVTIPVSCCCMAPSACSTWAASSLPCTVTVWVRSPWAMVSATAMACPSEREMPRTRAAANRAANSRPATIDAIAVVRILV